MQSAVTLIPGHFFAKANGSERCGFDDPNNVLRDIGTQVFLGFQKNLHAAVHGTETSNKAVDEDIGHGGHHTDFISGGKGRRFTKVTLGTVGRLNASSQRHEIRYVGEQIHQFL